MVAKRLTAALQTTLGLVLIGLGGGCATVMNEPTQRIQIQTVGADGQPIEMRCKASHGPAEYFGNSPMFDLRIRRSSSDLVVECRSGALVARGTAVSRGTAGRAVAAVLPGGTTSLIIDHMTGYSYAYPGWLQLRVGMDLVFDASNNVAGHPTPSMQAEAR